MTRWLPPIALAVALAGCAPTLPEGYLVAFAKGQRDQRAGRFDDAARAYHDAAAYADRVKDRDEARFLEARALERAGHWDAAEATYQRLVRDSPRGPRTGRASFELARLTLDHRDARLGYQMLQDVAVRFPNHGVATVALRQVIQHIREDNGEAALREWLVALAPSVAGTDLEERLEYERARSLHREGLLDQALAEYVATATRHPYPRGALTDDALLHAAEVAEALGRPRLAVSYLETLLAPREDSHTLGSYERPRYSEAQMKIAELYRDALGDRGRARDSFHRLYAEHPTSTLRDDALWQEAKLWRVDGDDERACDVLETLVDDFPESRFAGCAAELCPDAKTPKATPCRDYIRREDEPREDGD